MEARADLFTKFRTDGGILEDVVCGSSEESCYCFSTSDTINKVISLVRNLRKLDYGRREESVTLMLKHVQSFLLY